MKTKEELLALIAAKIDGQGNQVDAGSSLGEILRGILEIAESGGNPTPVAPLKVADNELSLELGAGLETDAEDKLAAKLSSGGGIQSKEDGLALIDGIIMDVTPETEISDADFQKLTHCPIIRVGGKLFPYFDGSQDIYATAQQEIQDAAFFFACWAELVSYSDDAIIDAYSIYVLYQESGTGNYYIKYIET